MCVSVCMSTRKRVCVSVCVQPSLCLPLLETLRNWKNRIETKTERSVKTPSSPRTRTDKPVSSDYLGSCSTLRLGNKVNKQNIDLGV